MSPKNIKFDCVEMKNRVQAELMREYEARKSEFPSYESFIVATADQDPWIVTLREKIRETSEITPSTIHRRKRAV